MPNSDKVKAAQQSDKGKKHMAKVQAINHAHKKNYHDDRKLRGVHNAAANAEDSIRLTEHEAAMLEAKQKREAKAAKATAYLGRCEAAMLASPDDEIIAMLSEATTCEPAKPDRSASSSTIRVARNVAMLAPKHELDEEQRKAAMIAMVQSRRKAFEQRTPRASQAAVANLDYGSTSAPEQVAEASQPPPMPSPPPPTTQQLQQQRHDRSLSTQTPSTAMPTLPNLTPSTTLVTGDVHEGVITAVYTY